eukprot:TRINITY_DN27694_c0_g1_i1.p1 TRINITY_DN27694_c0_g1~~TRINITY_DN27694_c0_g1_i1.p1  ORF type:complete len:734 (+),score=242.33 TRINITY_DN27694_c0_g1_i1:90-2291(+)
MSAQAFQQPGFDPRAWINKELSGVPRGALESTVNALSLKLQVLGNELNTSFEDQVMQALAKLPMCSIDLDRVSREVGQLSVSLTEMLTPDVIQKQQEAEAATVSISKLHAKKAKLDQCLDTLSQTVYLNENVHTMDAAFQEGDTAVIASEIHKMQQALEAIKGYEHHDKLAAKIAKYEEGLQEMVESECVTALLQRDIPKAKEHLRTLEKIGRVNDILVQYTRHMVGPMSGEWKKFAQEVPMTPGDDTWEFALVDFLDAFNGKLERALAESCKYYTEVLGSNATQVILEYYTMVQRDTAHVQNKYYGSLSPPCLVQCFTKSVACMEALKDRYFDSATEAQVSMLAEASYSPYAQLQVQYPKTEEQRLLALIRGFRFVRELGNSSSVTINPGLVGGISESASTLLQECQQAVERCVSFTLIRPGDEAQSMQLAKAINSVVAEFTKRVLDVSTRLRRALALDDDASGGGSANPSPTSPSRPPPSIGFDGVDPVRLKICLQLHSSAAGVAQKFALFTQWMEGYIAALPAGPAADALRHVYGSASGRVFAEAGQEVQGMEDMVESIAFDLLFAPVRRQLAELPAMPTWAQAQQSQYYAGTPLESLRHVGDHLLSLPDTLGQSSAELDRNDDYTWVVLVLKRTAEYFVGQVAKIPQLSEAGVKQLATDVEYLENVLSEFGQEVPSLKALLLLASAAPEEYAAALEDATKLTPEAAALHAMLQAKRLPAGTATPSPPPQ